MDRIFLCRCRVLEPGGGRDFRIHDQPADRAVLHAGAQHDRRPCPRVYGVYGTLGLALLLFCMRAMKPEMKNTKLLGFAFWAMTSDCSWRSSLSATDRPVANLPVGLGRLLVRTKSGVHANGTDAIPAVDAVVRGYFLQSERSLLSSSH